MDALEQEDELEEVRGWPFHHYDCPACGDEVIIESDPSGEVIECDCGYKFLAG